MNTFITRLLLVITFIIGCILISCIEDQTPVLNMLGCFVTFICLCYICYFRMSKNTVEVNNNILGITWLENKTGLNFSEE